MHISSNAGARSSARRLLTLGGFLALSALATACGDNAEAAAEADSATSHQHDSVFEVPVEAIAPTIEIELVEDTANGYNLLIETTDYTLAPERASTGAVFGEGHFHLYVDGEKTTRFYNSALHLGDLAPGQHELIVELSANNHATYAVNGEKIQDTLTIDVPEPTDDAAMGHLMPEPVAVSGVTPALDVSVVADPKSGWNLHAAVENFTFAPRDAGAEPVAGEGHLHLYLDGTKIACLYGPWWHIPALSEGSHDIMVEMNANTHSPWAVDGEPIRAMTTIEVSADQASDMAMASGDDHEHSMTSMAETLDIPAAEADVVVEITVADGSVSIDGGDDRIEVTEGQSVGITVMSDQSDTLHVHGFDVLVPLQGGAIADVAFTADQSGLFEVELEDDGIFVFELLVR